MINQSKPDLRKIGTHIALTIVYLVNRDFKPVPTQINNLALNKSQIAAKHIKFASEQTGADFDYLLQTAKRESAFNPDAKAKTSSATGLFQFVRQTWYETMHDFGPIHGYENFSKHIQRDDNGRYNVPNQAAKTAILELRKDPKAASLMAAEFSNQNMKYLSHKIGRDPKASELYMAHFMGRGAAAKLINLEAKAPNANAAEIFPQHAASNKPIFYSKGQARSIRQVYDNLAKHHVQLAKSKGLDPTNIENVSKLVPFLPSNDGFYGSLFGQQDSAEKAPKPLAYTGIGTGEEAQNSAAIGHVNNLLMAQIASQNSIQQQQVYINDNAKPLPEAFFSQYDSASLAKGNNFFSVTAK